MRFFPKLKQWSAPLCIATACIALSTTTLATAQQEERTITLQRPGQARSFSRSFTMTDKKEVEKTLDSLNLDPKVKERIMKSLSSSGGQRGPNFSWSTSNDDEQDSASVAQARAKAKERTEKRRKEQQEKMLTASKEVQQKLQEALSAMQDAQKEAQRDLTKDEDAMKSATKKFAEAQKKLQEAQKELSKARVQSVQGAAQKLNLSIPGMHFNVDNGDFSVFGEGQLRQLEGMTERLGNLRLNMPRINTFIHRDGDDDDDTEVIINGEVVKPRGGQWSAPRHNQSFRFRMNDDDDDNDNEALEEKRVIIKKNKRTVNGKTEVRVEVNTDDDDMDEAPKAPKAPAAKTPKAPKPAKAPKQSEKSNFQD